MTPGDFLRRRLPAIGDFVRAAREARRRRARIWDGIYRTFSDVPREGAGYEGAGLAADACRCTEQALEAGKRHGNVPGEVVDEHALLPLLVAVAAFGRRCVRILDFGGGAALAYVHLRSSTTGVCALDYHVVETEAVCERARPLFAGDGNVHFHSQLPGELPGLDIVHVCSALQYIDDYSAVLRQLMSYGARHFLFVKLSAGDIPTYVTAQRNLPGTVTPYRFLNVLELVEIMSRGGYTLIYKSVLAREYNQDNFPAGWRMGRACNLLFCRTADGAPSS